MPVNVISVSDSLSNGKQHANSGSHKFVVIYKGSVTLKFDDSSIKLTAGELIFIPQNNNFIFSLAETSPAIRVINIFAQDFSKYPLLRPAVLTQSIREIIDIICRDYRNKPIAVEHLVLALMELYTNSMYSDHEISSRHFAVDLVKSLIAKNYNSDINLSKLAESVKMSKEHLIRVFKGAEGITPINYLWNYRCEKALEMLKSSQLNNKDISEACGFKSYYHFARSIKEATGLTPTQLRHPENN